MSDYERYFRVLIARNGYHSASAFAHEIGISPQTLEKRLKGACSWTMPECRALQEALHLKFWPWVMLTVFHVSPYDPEYPIMLQYATEYLANGGEW